MSYKTARKGIAHNLLGVLLFKSALARCAVLVPG